MSAVFLQTFAVDVTPPIGDYLCGGPRGKSIGAETPLWLRGVILSTNETRFVVASIEYCYLVGTSYQRFVDAIAHGAGVPAEQVTLHATHVHDAPLIDEDVQKPLEEMVPGLFNETAFSKILSDVSNAVARACTAPQTKVGSIGFAEYPITEFASNRRVIGSDGKCRTRWSICEDESLRSAPIGKIDPMLRSVVFYDEATGPVAALFFYASHPQVSDGRFQYSGDTPGLAIDLFNQAHPRVFAMYFTGCAGDITAGKFTTTDKQRNRHVFGPKLHAAMEDAFAHASPQRILSLTWRNDCFEIPLSSNQAQTTEYWQSFLQDPDVSAGGIWRKTVAVGRLRRQRQQITAYPFRLTRLSINQIDMLFLPAELLIEYQLYATSIARGKLAVAAYGDSFLSYVPTDDCFDQGGYEVDPWCTEVGCGVEPLIKEGIRRILADSSEKTE